MQTIQLISVCKIFSLLISLSIKRCNSTTKIKAAVAKRKCFNKEIKVVKWTAERISWQGELKVNIIMKIPKERGKTSTDVEYLNIYCPLRLCNNKELLRNHNELKNKTMLLILRAKEDFISQ